MNRRWSACVVVGTILTAGVGAAACSSSTTAPTLTPKQLVGTWALDSAITQAGTFTPPTVNGRLQLTDSTYHEHVVTHVGPNPGDTVAQADSGTYKVNGGTFTQTSQTGQPSVQATAAIRGNDTLDVKVTSPSQAAGTYVWVRQH